jgi:hypothetical protein
MQHTYCKKNACKCKESFSAKAFVFEKKKLSPLTMMQKNKTR